MRLFRTREPAPQAPPLGGSRMVNAGLSAWQLDTTEPPRPSVEVALWLDTGVAWEGTPVANGRRGASRRMRRQRRETNPRGGLVEGRVGGRASSIAGGVILIEGRAIELAVGGAKFAVGGAELAGGGAELAGGGAELAGGGTSIAASTLGSR